MASQNPFTIFFTYEDRLTLARKIVQGISDFNPAACAKIALTFALNPSLMDDLTMKDSRRIMELAKLCSEVPWNLSESAVLDPDQSALVEQHPADAVPVAVPESAIATAEASATTAPDAAQQTAVPPLPHAAVEPCLSAVPATAPSASTALDAVPAAISDAAAQPAGASATKGTGTSAGTWRTCTGLKAGPILESQMSRGQQARLKEELPKVQCSARFAVEGVVAGGIKQKNIAAEGRNCWVLGDIGNMVTLRGAEGKQQLPQVSCHLTRGFCAQLLANAQAAAADKNKKCIGAVNVDGFAAAKGETAPASSWPTLPNRSLLCRPLLVDIGRCTCVIVKETSPDGFNGGTLYSLYTYAGTKAPRQPWHDLHCRIDGPAAYDMLINFAQRWRRATRWREFAFLKKARSKWNDDAMIKVERISWILSPAFSIGKEFTSIPEDDPKLYVNENDQSKHWHVQIFCSINSGSVKGFPKRIDIAEKQNLICGKNLAVDKSIETAYIQAIRSAQNFIYIENQYFLGSSYACSSYEDAGADHLIPMELAMKVVSKIRANQRKVCHICCYANVWPEGDPKTATMQEILFWQSQTMHMIYQVIAQEIKSMQLDEHPSDYLNFYCLGNREDVPSSVSESLKFQRFMIYVHAKGMIVDDESLLCRPLPVDIGRCTCVIVKETSPDGFNGGTLYSLYTYISKQYELDFRDRGRPDLKIQSSVKNFQLIMELNDEFIISQENKNMNLELIEGGWLLYPMTGYQAFFICLASIDAKLCCSGWSFDH
nr:phospholipase D delta-like [Ipomoea batatas]